MEPDRARPVEVAMTYSPPRFRFKHRVHRRLPGIAALCLGVCLSVGARTALAVDDELPDIGNSAGAVLSSSEEQKIGRMIMRQLRASGSLVIDPQINEYIQAVGQRVSQFAHEGNLDFTFFVVDDPSLNAFAMPGGFIGIHSGLLLATQNENELVGVLAHEIAHISQRHLARSAEAAGQNGLVSTAAMVAAILVGAASGVDGNAVQAAIAVAQGSAMQQRINFTRANEYEADRVGIGFVADAGYDPMGMPTFFETMSRRSNASIVPEYFRTHPVTSNRIAETRERASRYPPRQVPSSPNYEVAKARALVLQQESAIGAIDLVQARIGGHPAEASAADRYALALALVRAGDAKPAVPMLARLTGENENLVAYHTLYAEAQIAAGASDAGLATFAEGYRLFPRNVPLTMAYAQALLNLNQPAEAHRIMLDLVNNVHYDEEQIRILALAASAEGDAANAHYYMSEFHVLRGELFMAIDQLKLALATPDSHDYQIARAEARLESIKKYLPKRRRSLEAEQRREPGGQRPH